MRLLVSSLLAGSALFLSSCQAFDTLDARTNQGPCPAAGSVYEAQRVVALNGEGERYIDIEYTGEINGVRLFCRYVGDDPIEAQLEIDFSFGRGAAATDYSHEYNYFVAVTRTNRAVISKEVFPLVVEFEDGQSVVTLQEDVSRIIIPRADETISGANFEILVGFELTDEERAFNAAGRRYLLQTQ